MNDVLKNLLKAVYGLSDEKAEAILAMEDAEQTTAILELDKVRVAKFKDLETKAHDKGHQKAKAEELKKIEAKMRSKYGIDDEALEGDDLLDAIDAKIEEAKAKGSKSKDLTEDAIKTHPVYVNAMKAASKAVIEKEAEWQKKFEERETTYGRSERQANAKAYARKMLDELNPVLPKNSTVANNLLELYAKKFEQFDYDFQDDGDAIIKTGDDYSKPYEDAHGKPVSFKEMTKQFASEFFEFAEATDRSSAANKTDTSKQKLPGTAATAGISGKWAVPKTLAEASDIINNKEIPPAEKGALLEVYNSAQAQ